MPTTNLRNLLYRAALPLLAPPTRGKMTHEAHGHTIDLKGYEDILRKYHVLGSSLLLTDQSNFASVHTSLSEPPHPAGENTLYRVASITKMATALVTLMLAEEGAFALDDPIAPLLPDASGEAALQGVTIRQLLCHTSGLRDTSAYDQALRSGDSFHAVLHANGVRGSNVMSYSNFGFGLLGCLMESVTGRSLEEVFRTRLFIPLGMTASLDASSLEESRIMPISRVLPYHKGQDVTITALGRRSIAQPDPLRHFGHTAGAMYTDCSSLSLMLGLIASEGAHEGRQLLSPKSIQQMTAQHSFTGPATSPTRRYGLGLVILDRPDISPNKLYGHQGFAYGCVDCAFFETGTGRQVVFLNGGCSEAREGLLGLCNKQLLTWALQKEIPAWK
ncbi:MAG: beta-lactamase family protein [Clostridiales bacterium]|nr:beta-lactamase family protein [Clostridiales bacterium]